MNSIKILLSALVIFSTQMIFAANPPAKDEDDIQQAVVNYVKNVDTQNSVELSKDILPAATFITFNKITNNVDNVTTSKFVSMVKDGQKGGWKREVNIGSVTVDGNTAVAKLDISDTKVVESGFVTLVKDNGTWKIASQVSNLQLNKQAGATQK